MALREGQPVTTNQDISGFLQQPGAPQNDPYQGVPVAPSGTGTVAPQPQEDVTPSITPHSGESIPPPAPFVPVEGVPNPDNSPLPDGSTQQFVNNSVFPEQQQRITDPQGVPPVPQWTEKPIAKDENPNSPENILKRIYATKPPEPKMDEERLKRLEKLSRINTIGRGVNVLGDILSLGMGANVNKRAADTMSSKLFDQYQATLDKYKGDKDVYDMRNYQKVLDDARLGMNVAEKAAAQEFANKKLEATTQAAKDKADLDWKKYLAGLKLKGIQAEALDRYHTGMVNAAKERNGIARTKAEKAKTGKPFHQVVIDGNTQDVDRGQYNQLYAMMVADPEFAKKNLRVDMSNYVNTPRTGMDIDIAKYAEANPSAVRKVLKLKEPNPDNPAQPTYIFRPQDVPGMEKVPVNQPAGTVTAPQIPQAPAVKKPKLLPD